jgi:photosystem II stability/assembly factor-like uncharacterized protein
MCLAERLALALLLAVAIPILGNEPAGRPERPIPAPPAQAVDDDDALDAAPSGAIRQSEDVDARTRDYLTRHGDNGVIDSELLLQRTREFHEQSLRERARPLALNGSAWVSLGPTNGAGRALSIAVDPTVAGTAIVGTAGGGAWKTTDAGVSWTPLTEMLPNLAIGAVTIAPSNPSIIYLGTGEAGTNGDRIPGIGLLVSSDGGLTWTLPSSVIATGFHRISVHPTNPQELVIATINGAYRSVSGFNGPWSQVITGGNSPGYGEVADLIRDPSNAQVLYAATWDGAGCSKGSCTGALTVNPPTVMKSADGGKTWSPAAQGLPVSVAGILRVSRITLALAASSPQTLYASLSTINPASGVEVCHVYKTTNGAASWSETALSSVGSVRTFLTPQSGYDNTITVSPTDPNVVIAGGVHYAKTTDGGQTWSPPAFAGTGVHVDAHDMRYDAGNTLFIANDGGIWTSTDNGATATARNSGLVTRQFYFVANDPVNRNRVYGGLQDNGTIRRPDAGGTDWDALIGGDGIGCLVNPAVPEMMFGSVQNERLFRTVTAGVTRPVFRIISPLFPSGELLPFRTLIVGDPSNPAVYYTPSYRLWKTSDGGETWLPLPTTTTDGTAWVLDRSIAAVAVARNHPEILMVSFSGSPFVYRSTNGGVSWARTNTGLPNRGITKLTIDPRDPSRAWATFAGLTGPSVYQTVDGAATWTASADGLPLFSAQSLLVDPTDSNTLYCGTDVGVYRSSDGGVTWSRFGTGIPAVSIDDLQVLDDGSALRAATHGRGMWELTINGITNHPPAVAISAPAAAQHITTGTTFTFAGTVTDSDQGDTTVSAWTFPDTWTNVFATNSGSVKHTFNRAGRYPVTLRAVDASGAVGAASVDVFVSDAGESCGSPIVIPSTGPFPWTVTVNTESSTRQPTDPGTLSPCYSFTPENAVWLSFTPATTGVYQFSFCGTRASGVLVGYTGASCGPYVATGLCLSNPPDASQNTDDPALDCASSSSSKTSATLTAGTTIRLMLSNFFSSDYGPTTLTVTQGDAFSPIVTSVSPAVGSITGGTVVTLTGSGFDSGLTVQFGGLAATQVTVLSANLATAVTPAGGAGVTNVVAKSNDGSSAFLANGFVYETPPPPGPKRRVAGH